MPSKFCSWIKTQWARFLRWQAGMPEFKNHHDCLNCGHAWMVHSFYGITRSECHEEKCECAFYTNIYMEKPRKCGWCEETGLSVDILLHEMKVHPEWFR